MGEIVVVVVEPHRQTLENARGQLLGIDSPLLDRVGLEEGLVETAPDKAKRLLLEASRRFDGEISLAFEEFPRLCGTQRLAEELVDHVQVDRKRVDGPACRRLHTVQVRLELHETGNVRPHFLVVGVEDVRPIDMQHHLRCIVALGMTVARNQNPLQSQPRTWTRCVGDC